MKYKIILVFFAALFALAGCEENPSDLGLNFISPEDTIGTHVLSSDADTITISSSNYAYHVPLAGSPNLLVGRYQSYESKGLIKLNNLPTNYDSATVNSVKLNLRYTNYFFKDSLGTLDFTVNRINRDLNFSTITADSVNASDFEAASSGSYNGNPVDTAMIVVTLNNQLMEDWLEHAADSSHPIENQGIGLLPTGASNTIKGFFSAAVNGLQPSIDIIVTKNGETDTLNFSDLQTTSIADAPLSAPAERMLVQSGVAFRTFLTFDLAKLPSNVIINDAQIQVTLDEPASFISTNYSNRLGVSMIIDSSAKTDTFRVVPSTQTFVNDVYTIKITPFVQYWNKGLFQNNGLNIYASTEGQTLDQFMLYSTNASDITRRPKLRIIYTLRN